MADAEGVVLALGPARERRQPSALLDGRELLAPPGQNLVRIGLMAYIPDQPIVGCLVHIMQCHREFDGAESRGKMPAARADALDQKLSQFCRQRRQLVDWQPAQSGR